MGLDPDHVVAFGAAVQAALVAGDRALDDMVMTDVAAFTLGVDTVHRVGNGWRDGCFAPIIERNPVVPTSRESTFQTVQLGQEKIRFGIYQGESPLVMHNLSLGHIEVPVPRNPSARRGRQHSPAPGSRPPMRCRATGAALG